MAGGELVFSLTASVENETASLWGKSDLRSTLLAYVSGLEGKVGSVAGDYKSVLAANIAAVGIIGGLINRDVQARKAQKLVDGEAYVLIDLVAQQISCKAQLANLVREGKRSTKAGWESVCRNVKELIQGAVKLQSLTQELERYGVFSSFILSALSDSEKAQGLQGAMLSEIISIAA